MKKAFTLVELLIVIGILGGLIALLIPMTKGMTESGRAAKCMTNLQNLAKAVSVYAQGSEFYPLAGSVERFGFDESRGIKNVRKRFNELPGWISWASNGAYKNGPESHVSSYGWFASAYNRDEETRYYCLTNGAIWNAVGNNTSCYRCPSHLKKFGGTERDPNWSYVMNEYFGWDESRGSKYKSEYYGGRRYESVKKANNILLFAELPWEGYAGEKLDFSAAAGTVNDCTLQYSGDGGQPETLGYNHKDGKHPCAHVVFADAHVEKIRWRPQQNRQDLVKLTKWLCEGADIVFNESIGKYEEMK